MRIRAPLTAVLIAVPLALVATVATAHAAGPFVYPTFKGDGAAGQELWIYQSIAGTWSGLSAVACAGCRHGTVARA